MLRLRENLRENISRKFFFMFQHCATDVDLFSNMSFEIFGPKLLYPFIALAQASVISQAFGTPFSDPFTSGIFSYFHMLPTCCSCFLALQKNCSSAFAHLQRLILLAVGSF